MKKNESTATKAVKKNTSATKKSGRGGARPGSGQKKVYAYDKQLNVDTTTLIIESLKAAGVVNKTVLINALVANFLLKQDLPEATKTELKEFIKKIGTVKVIRTEEE